MDKIEKRARVVLACDYEITPRKLKILLDKYGSANNILSRKEEDNLIHKQLHDKKSNISEIIDLNNVIVYGEEIYPKLLAQIPDLPLALFFKGDIKSIDFDKCIGIVGTRRISKYGISVTKGLVKFLVERGFTIVSGLAYGVDALAHQEALACGGQTIAVLGTAIDDPYPPSNRGLYNKIINNSGLVLSETIEKSSYGKWMFPKRNRIIAGLCKKLIVIEAPEKSGALITANLAFDYNRDVFGIPGDVFGVNSLGVHKLIKDDIAHILCKYDDLFEKDQLVFKLNCTNILFTKFETEVVECIMLGNNTIETLVEKLRYDINMLLSILGGLELNNTIERFEDGSFMVK